MIIIKEVAIKIKEVMIKMKEVVIKSPRLTKCQCSGP